MDRPAGQAVPPPPEEPDRLREEDRLEVLHHLHEHPGQRDRRRRRAATTRSTSTSCTASTPSSRPAASAPRRPWACGTSPPRPGRSTRGWVIAANIAADLTAWTRLLGLCDHQDLRDADPDTLRYRIWHIPARRPARPRAHPQDQPGLALAGRIPHLLAAALRAASTCMTSTNHPVNAKGGPSRRRRSRCAPGHTGHCHSPRRQQQTDTRPETGHQHNQ